MEKLVERPLSLGVAIPGVNANVATGPVPPLLPQAPQLSQLVESCTLSITVLAGVVGVGVGDAAGVGVGEATGVGVGAGFDVPLPFEATTEFPALPPQPMINVVSNAIETSESEVHLLCTAKSPKIQSSAQSPVPTFGSKFLFSAEDFTGAMAISYYSELLSSP
jgi:hypothetical protein